MSKARIAAAFALTLSVFGCSSAATRHGGSVGGNGPTTGASGGGGTGGGTTSNGGGGTSNGGGSTSSGGGSGDIPGCVQGMASSTVDQDMDGYSPSTGDCDDCNPLINPGAINIPGDPTSYNCSGNNNVTPACDPASNPNTAAAIAQSMELCDSRFLISSALGANVQDSKVSKGRNVLPNFGVLTPHAGKNMALMSSGLAVDEHGPGYVLLQDGTPFGSMGIANPLPGLKAAANCGTTQSDVNDYNEVVFTMKAPTNVKSFSFDFQFFSAEYPEFVCSMYNDEFLAIVQSPTTYPTAQNISFDSKNNPVTINSGFFTICDQPGCATPVSAIDGTGYETITSVFDPTTLQTVMEAVGGSTGWLTTTVPINPGETFTLRFVVFDEGDDIYDSAVLLDNFTWGTTAVSAPVTGPITYRTTKTHHKAVRAPKAESLMCGA